MRRAYFTYLQGVMVGMLAMAYVAYGNGWWLAGEFVAVIVGTLLERHIYGPEVDSPRS